MSAFVAMIDFDGQAPDVGYLEAMARYLSQVGPDRQSVWTDNGVGFVHALLKTSPQNVINEQPFVTSRYAVIGDVRLDGKDELLESLSERSTHDLTNKQDIEILLRAWLIWGSRATEHLFGDFAVAIWDRQKQRTFCLRDQMGVKQLFYARKGKLLLISSALNCLRKHPLISDDLNDQAVVDFLTFGFNSDFSTSMFSDIQRLPPGHMLEVCKDSQSIRRYWDLPVSQSIRYARLNDYVEHFKEILKMAISDRLGSADAPGVAMSGGLDSTSVAAFARQLKPNLDGFSLYTLDISELWPDDREAGFAAMVADTLGVSHHIFPVLPSALFEQQSELPWSLPEPARDSFWPTTRAVFRQMSRKHRIGLTGHGSDPLLMPSAGHFAKLLRSRDWKRLLRDTLHFYRIHQSRPPFRLRSSLKRTYERAPWSPKIPHWLRPQIVDQTGLGARFDLMLDIQRGVGTCDHPERPEAYRDLASPIWPFTIQRFDPQTTGLPIEFRHPFRDVRLVKFALAMPASPWFYSKSLLRFATAGVLPSEVRLRKKATPDLPPVYQGMLKRGTSDLKERILDTENATRYIDMRHFNKMIEYPERLKPNETDQVALPVSYVNWLLENSL